jgi:outer membrane protein OmpA-like peptidoglycan-associated protein
MASQAEAAVASQRASESAALAQSLAAQLADLQTQLTNRGMVVTLGDVLFETGSARLREAGIRAVDRLATFMREHPERTVAVEGFTDSMGSEVFNQELSERRATTIRNALSPPALLRIGSACAATARRIPSPAMAMQRVAR